MDPCFYLLKPAGGWLAARDETKVLGAATHNCWRPLDDSKPERPMTYNQGRPLTELTFNHFILGTQMQQENVTQASIEGLFRIRGQAQQLQQFTLRGKQVKMKRLQQYPVFWNKLLSLQEDFVEPVKEWCQDVNWLRRPRCQPYWIVGILTCQNVTIAATDEDARLRRIRGDVALGSIADLAATAHGIPFSTENLGNISGELSNVTDNSQCFIARGEQEYICAVELKRIVLRSDQLELKEKGPSARPWRQLGSPEAGTDDDAEVMEFDNMSESDWAMLVNDIED